MAEERGGMIIGDRVEAWLDKLTEDVAEIKGTLIGFKMAFDQMDKRLSTTHWVMGLIVATQVVVLSKLFLK